MNILLDEQELQIQEAISEFLGGECSPALVRDVEAKNTHYSAPLWNKFAENGWLQLCLTEASGGQGLPLSYLALLFESAGYTIAPLPLHSTLVAATIIDRHGSDAQRAVLNDVAAGSVILSHAVAESTGRWEDSFIGMNGRVDGTNLVLNGRKCFVANYGSATHCLVVYRKSEADAGLGVVLVPTNSLGLVAQELVSMAKDGEFNVEFTNVSVPLTECIQSGAEGSEVAHELMDLSAVLYASLMAGAARKTLDMAVEHAKQRVAFGQPIGAFQAIQHLCANMLNAVDGSMLLAREALWRMEQGLPHRTNVAQAKSFANEHCMMAVRSAQQIHGGMGFMLEFDLNLWYRRVGSWTLRGGTVTEHRKTLAAALLDRPRRVRIGKVAEV